MDAMPDTGSSPGAAVRSVAPWLGLLFVLVFVVNMAGGWVRLSGSGVAIPEWPFIDGGLLPPVTDDGWMRVRDRFDADQARLRARVERGELTPANLGREPADMAEFKGMFLTEWTHRLLSAAVGVVGLGCLTVVLRHRAARVRIAGPLAAVAALVAVQAVLGGLIVAHGTNTHFLFLHQGNAALTMACLLIALVRVVDGSRPGAAVLAPRRGLILAATACVVLVWGEIVVGALVAGSRNGGPFNVHPVDAGRLLWRHDQTLGWNLLDNAQFHQWLHRITGWSLAVALAGLFLLGWLRRAVLGQRARLVLMVAATFLPMQLVLGLSNVEVGIVPALSLAHQTMGMCLFLSLVLVWHDLRCEGAARSLTPSSRPALAGGAL